MEKDLIKLIEAQKVDLEIDKLNKNKKDYPIQKENLEKEIETTKNTLEKIKIDIAEKEKTRRNIETEIAAERETQLEKRGFSTQKQIKNILLYNTKSSRHENVLIPWKPRILNS